MVRCGGENGALHNGRKPGRVPVMLYNAYELQRAWLTGAGAWASVTAELLSNPMLPINQLGLGPVMSSALDVFAHAAAPRG